MFLCLFSGYAGTLIDSPRAVWTNCIRQMSEGNQRVGWFAGGNAFARLKSRTRSHSGNKLRASLPAAETEWIPGDTDRKEAPPPSCHTSAHHTSHKLHAPFRLECGGPASRMVSLTHSIVFARCVVTCSASLYTPENLPPWEKKLLGQTGRSTKSSPVPLLLSLFFHCGSILMTCMTASNWVECRLRSEVTNTSASIMA